MIIIAVLAALAAGACFAVGGVLQQREASTRPADEAQSLRLLADLAHRPAWLAGIGATAGSFLFKAVALAFGPLTVVQPLIASELVFAIPVSVRRHGFRLHLREWSGIGGDRRVDGGDRRGRAAGGQPAALAGGLWEALGALAVLTAGALLAARRVRGAARASLYALAAVATLAAKSSYWPRPWRCSSKAS
ncbi:MAG TPA: hypothetical protein VFW64_04630 [Pseudonocardiaceae bacterium]|nr:hypothetical protein [Pseudonocardiaceae bacterium]